MKTIKLIYVITIAILCFFAISCSAKTNEIKTNSILSKNVTLFKIFYDQYFLLMTNQTDEHNKEIIAIEQMKELQICFSTGDIRGQVLYSMLLKSENRKEAINMQKSLLPRLREEAKKKDWLACKLLEEFTTGDEQLQWQTKANRLLKEAYTNEDPIALLYVFYEKAMAGENKIVLHKILLKLKKYNSKFASYCLTSFEKENDKMK